MTAVAMVRRTLAAAALSGFMLCLFCAAPSVPTLVLSALALYVAVEEGARAVRVARALDKALDAKRRLDP